MVTYVAQSPYSTQMQYYYPYYNTLQGGMYYLDGSGRVQRQTVIEEDLETEPLNLGSKIGKFVLKSVGLAFSIVKAVTTGP
ncbi:unnamed protein product [Adineta ricciae]|uniref:Uncharacterized protein n=1 Tax=Adineta ricciae TaxID=249248 RepID=A0A815YUR9_ADIRI|nr:unnamed protein product [Adineta ricciae]